MEVSDLRTLPSVDALLQTTQAAELISTYGRPLTVAAFRTVLADYRSQVEAGKGGNRLTQGQILEQADHQLQNWNQGSLVPVINATGVILHTNLGRAPLSRAAYRAIEDTARGYTNLEFDLATGTRGSRLTHAEELLIRLTGAEAALVVNNNAAAVLLTLTGLAKRKRVIISRTQLVEIGGGFRIPEVLNQTGAHLFEIGATNRVHISDYQSALKEPVGIVLNVHHSNYQIIGFSSEPDLEEIARTAHQAGIPLVDDLGSGALLDTAAYGLAHEPTVIESLAAGADLVCFSGDKLLGGPQAGILVGRKELIDRLKKHPLARAVRADKLSLAALTATLQHYLLDQAEQEIPVWQMIASSLDDLQKRAQSWTETLGFGTVIPTFSTIGGGSLPGETIPTIAFGIEVRKPNLFLKQLRKCTPPIIARIMDERIILDPRTVLPFQEGALLLGLQEVMQSFKREE